MVNLSLLSFVSSLAQGQHQRLSALVAGASLCESQCDGKNMQPTRADQTRSLFSKLPDELTALVLSKTDIPTR